MIFEHFVYQKGRNEMKKSKWFLAVAIADTFAGICFAVAAARQAESLSRWLFGIAAVGMLTGGACLFAAYRKGKQDGQ